MPFETNGTRLLDPILSRKLQLKEYRCLLLRSLVDQDTELGVWEFASGLTPLSM